MSSFFSQFKMVDLTHTLQPSVPTWAGNCGYQHKVIVDYEEACRVQHIEMNSGTGTHLDAPLHFIPNAASVADIPIENFFNPICIIDVSDKAHADYQISYQDIKEFEKKFGKISEKSLVVGYTGWDQYWNDPNKFRSPDAKGKMHFPDFSIDAAKYLLDRNISGLGIDSLSPDCHDLTFPVHHLILGANKFIVENLANCKSLPPTGAFSIILPIKTAEGTEAVVRAVALILK